MLANPPTTATSTKAYQTRSRARSERPNITFQFTDLLNHISLPAARADEILAELAPHVADVHIQQIRHRVVVFIENVVVDFAASHELPASQREIFHDCI